MIELTAESISETIKKAYEELSVSPNKYFEECRNTAKKYSWDNVAKRSIMFYQKITKKNG